MASEAEVSIIQPRIVSTKQMELQTAKEILAEVFHVRPNDVDDMIQRRLEDRRVKFTSGWPQHLSPVKTIREPEIINIDEFDACWNNDLYYAIFGATVFFPSNTPSHPLLSEYFQFP